MGRAPQNRRPGMNNTGAPAPIPTRRSGGRARNLAIVWTSVLAVFLIFALIISSAGRRDPKNTAYGTGDTVHAISNLSDTLPVNAEPSYPVSYAEYDDGTASFSGSLSLKNGILIDLRSNKVIASKNGDSRIYPASMTKIMTLITAYENTASLDETFTMTAAITDPLFIENASVAGFAIGEEVTVRDLIYGLILPSGGDGALGLANHISGSEEAFVKLMNEKAAELGLKDTHFTNCTGLHNADHYSTCHDIALILEYAIKDDFMRTVLSTYRYTTAKTPEHPDGIELTSTLLSRMYGDESGTAFVIGGKTGYTPEAHNCLATFATNFTEGEPEEAIYGRSPDYVLVTAGSADKWGPVFDAIEIYKTFGGDSSPAAAGTDSEGSDTKKAANGTDNGENAGTSIDRGGGVIVYTAADPTID